MLRSGIISIISPGFKCGDSDVGSLSVALYHVLSNKAQVKGSIISFIAAVITCSCMISPFCWGIHNKN